MLDEDEALYVLFEQAFAAADPVPPLLSLLKTHPTYPAICSLVLVYSDTVFEDRGQYLDPASPGYASPLKPPPLGKIQSLSWSVKS